MSLTITYRGQRVEYYYAPYCKKGFGARPSPAIRFDLAEVAQRISGSAHFKLRRIAHNYIIAERGEVVISVMGNGEMLLEQIPVDDTKGAEAIVKEFFYALNSTANGGG